MIALRTPLDWLHVEIVGVTIATIASHYFLADRTKLPYNLFYAHTLGGNGVLSTEQKAGASTSSTLFASVLWDLKGGPSRFFRHHTIVTCNLENARTRTKFVPNHSNHRAREFTMIRTSSRTKFA